MEEGNVLVTEILLVDDDEGIRTIIGLYLKKDGYVVHTAPGGRECRETLDRIRPDLIILDIMMEPVDGWETLESIRSVPGIRDIPTMMFSGKSPTSEEIGKYGGWI